MSIGLSDYLKGDSANEYKHLLTLMHTNGAQLLASRVINHNTQMIEAYILNDEVSPQQLMEFLSSDSQGSIIAAELILQLIDNHQSSLDKMYRYNYELPLLKNFSVSDFSFSGQIKIKKLIEWIEFCMPPGSPVVHDRKSDHHFTRISNDSALGMNKPHDLISLYYPPIIALDKSFKLISALGAPEQRPKHHFFLCAKVFNNYQEQRRQKGDDAFKDFEEQLSLLRGLSLSELPLAASLRYRDVFALTSIADMELSEDERVFFAPWHTAIADALSRTLEDPSPSKLHLLQFKGGFINDIPSLAHCLSMTVSDQELVRRLNSVLMANALNSEGHLSESTTSERINLMDSMEHQVDWPSVLKMAGKKAEGSLVKHFGFRDSFGQYLSSNGKRQALIGDLGL